MMGLLRRRLQCSEDILAVLVRRHMGYISVLWRRRL